MCAVDRMLKNPVSKQLSLICKGVCLSCVGRWVRWASVFYMFVVLSQNLSNNDADHLLWISIFVETATGLKSSLNQLQYFILKYLFAILGKLDKRINLNPMDNSVQCYVCSLQGSL